MQPIQQTVPLRTPQGNVPALADEIIGSFAVVNLSQYMQERTIYFGVSHVASGWGFAAFSDRDVAIKFAEELEETGLSWDEIYTEVDAGIRMDDMMEAKELIRLYQRSFHDTHSLYPLAPAPYMPQVIIEEVLAHWEAMHGDAN